MKTNHILILVFMACLLLVAAGCTGTSGASPASSAGTAAPTFNGKWMTTWQAGGNDIPMTLTQTGSAVAGTYEYNTGTITGTVQGTTLTGIWTEDNGQSKGPVEFVISADGKTFAGWWGYEGDDFAALKKETPTWTGIRV
jgi:hypothetical protein